MADSIAASKYVLHNEDPRLSGAVVSDPTREDPLAVARFGVNSARHPELMDQGFYDPEKVSTEDALRTAEDVFKYDYFLHMGGYSIVDQDVANKFCDLAFNSGIPEASEIVQRAVNDVLKPAAPLDIDGIPGSRTIACINACEAPDLLLAIRLRAKDFYRTLAAEHPELFQKDLAGWLARVDR